MGAMSDIGDSGGTETEGILDYHAHVYYDAGSKATAARLREAIAARFEVVLGRWHDKPVGPHPMGSYQVVFGPALFATLVPWLMLNRAGLTVLIHPNTGDDLADHRDRALWLGQSRDLDLSALRPESA